MRRQSSPRSSLPIPKQNGYAIILMLVLVTMGILYTLVSQVSLVGMKTGRAQDTNAALLEAKEALLGWSVSFHDNDSTEIAGYLPCPDTTGDGVADTINNSVNCGAIGETVAGMLPYRTLGLGDLRDSTGNCLWYVVSGSYKTSLSKAVPVNWDTQGKIAIFDSSGTNSIVSPNDLNGGAAAVIIAAGAPLPGQNRAGSTNVCGTVPSAAQLSAYLESTINATGTTGLTQGDVKDVNGNPIKNDQILAITPKEIFTRIVARSDTPGFINTRIQNIKAQLNNALGTHPAAAGNNLPTTNPFAVNTLDRSFYDNWKNNFRYLTCPSGTYCYDIQTQSCDGALVFAGQSSNASPRPTTAVLADYFEDASPANSLSLVNGTTFDYSGGVASYLNTSRSADVVECLTPQPASMNTVSFTNNLGQFDQTESQSNIVTPSAGANRVRLGNAGSSTGYGCFWYPTVFPMRNGVRVYFQFRVPSPPSTNVGSFTFAVADAATNLTPTNMCGGAGEYLGYAGNNGVTAPINYPKIGLEFDKIGNAGRNDPASNHATFVYWGNNSDNITPPAPSTLDDDNRHGAGGSANPLNPSSGTGIAQRAITINVTYSVRLDIVRSYSATNHNGTYTLRAYVSNTSPSSCPIANFSNLSSDLTILCPALNVSQLGFGYLTDTITINDVSASAAMRQVYLGFTTGQEGQNQRVDITNFSAQTR